MRSIRETPMVSLCSRLREHAGVVTAHKARGNFPACVAGCDPAGHRGSDGPGGARRRGPLLAESRCGRIQRKDWRGQGPLLPHYRRDFWHVRNERVQATLKHSTEVDGHVQASTTESSGVADGGHHRLLGRRPYDVARTRSGYKPLPDDVGRCARARARSEAQPPPSQLPRSPTRPARRLSCISRSRSAFDPKPDTNRFGR